MQDKTLKISPETKGGQKETSFQSKRPLAENHSDLKKFLILAIDKTLETLKETNPCPEFSLKVEKKLEQIYGFDGTGLARLYWPVFDYLTAEEFEKGKPHKIPLIPSGNAKGISTTVWRMDKESEEKIQNEKERIAEEILKNKIIYLQANIERYGIKFEKS